MDFSRFDKYYKYLIAAALTIALLTFWRFREINLPEAYSYVAQQNVVHPMLVQSIAGAHSIVWDFFGLLNKIFIPDSTILLRLVGLCLTVLNYFLLLKLLTAVLGHRFGGFLCVFLVSLSPYTVVGAVSGVPAASSATITILFLMALYNNEYVFGGVLSGIAVAANLPGVIMFLITILDLLQNSNDKKKILKGVLSSAAGFSAVVLVLSIYSMYSGAARVHPIPIGEQGVPWSWIGIIPLFVVNIVDVAGVIYLLVARRYDLYRTHFHALMLWLTFNALCVALPTTTNLLVALVVSAFLATYYIQGFASIWNFKMFPVEAFVFLFALFFLSADIYANNKYLQDNVLKDCQETTQEVNEIVASIIPVDENSQIISNFAPSELSVRLMKQVVEIQGEPFPLEGLNIYGARTIYVVDRISKLDSLYQGCKLLMKGSYEAAGRNHFIEVIQCEEKINER